MNAKSIVALISVTLFAAISTAEETRAPVESTTLFTNVNVFDGSTDALRMDCNVLIANNRIVEVCSTSTEADTVIDGQGRTLMPGLIDGHVHFNFMVESGVLGLETKTWEEIGAMAVYGAQEWLKNGFTTVRDMCGMNDGLRSTIDKGFIAGPRIYLSGACISQTTGHGDFRFKTQSDHYATNVGRLGLTRLVDGRAEVLKGTRDNFANGADYIKIMISGGVSSEKDPLHATQFFDDEIRAAVEVAESFDSYVAAHVYQDHLIDRGLDLGIKVFDHAQMISEKTLRKLKKQDAYISPNTIGMTSYLSQHPVYGNPHTPVGAKTLDFQAQTKDLFEHLRKVKPKILFNTDIVFTQGEALRAGIDYQKWHLASEIGNFETLKSMTSTAGEVMGLTGKNNPYPGKLGVIEAGALADIILVDGNPLEDITVIGARDKWFDAEPRGPEVDTINLIMKDGVIYKNTL